jgi:hypothetical protein
VVGDGERGQGRMPGGVDRVRDDRDLRGAQDDGVVRVGAQVGRDRPGIPGSSLVIGADDKDVYGASQQQL